jgi:hypothetical protein
VPQALGLAAIKAVAAIVGITVAGRALIRPLYKKISNLANAEIFAATTLLVVLGTSFMTQLAGARVRGGCGARRARAAGNDACSTARTAQWPRVLTSAALVALALAALPSPRQGCRWRWEPSWPACSSPRPSTCCR